MPQQCASPWTQGLAGLMLLALAGSAPAQVVPSAPYPTAPVNASIPALPGASGPLIDSPVNQATPNDVHEGIFTWGADLVTPGTASVQGWLDSVDPASSVPLSFTASPLFVPRLEDEALVAANQHLSALDPGGVGKVFEFFDELPGAPVDLPDFRKDRFFGYRPVRARWLKSQYAPTGEVFWLVEKKRTYPDYFPFEDIRLRGARLYCAARRAQFVQGGNARSLGERVGFSISILGQTIDFLVVEPTVALDGPSKFLAPSMAGASPDGAQAFSIPFLFGTRVTPVRGLGLPGLGEARVPVVLVTGDTEVKTAANKRPIFEIGPGGLTWKNDYSKEYHTVTHADAILSAGFYADQKYSVDKEFPLFVLGPLVVKGLFELDYEVGKPGEASVTPPPDDRVLQIAPWPNTARQGHLYQNPGGLQYHDGAWLLARRRGSPFLEWQAQPDGSTDPVWTDPIGALSPTDLRALTNDDHTLRTSTALGLTLGIQGDLGATAGPFEVGATVHGSFTGSVAQHHHLRDALMAEEPTAGFLKRMVPSTVVTVRPQQTAEVTFNGMTATLHFYLDLGFFGSISFDKEFFSLPKATIADYDSDDSWTKADEKYMLRIGTGSASMTKPAVYSHLPGGQDFPSFLTTVSACLADETPAPELNPPCTVPPDNGTPPKVNICLYGPSLSLVEKLGSMQLSLPPLPPNACASPGTWPSGFGMTPEVKACFTSLLGLLCEPVSKQQTWQGVSVVSRVWNLTDPIGWALKDVIDKCQLAFVDPDVPITPEFADLVKEMVAVGPCKDDATLVDDSAIIQAVNPTQAPKAKPGATCAQ